MNQILISNISCYRRKKLAMLVNNEDRDKSSMTRLPSPFRQIGVKVQLIKSESKFRFQDTCLCLDVRSEISRDAPVYIVDCPRAGLKEWVNGSRKAVLCFLRTCFCYLLSVILDRMARNSKIMIYVFIVQRKKAFSISVMPIISPSIQKSWYEPKELLQVFLKVLTLKSVGIYSLWRLYWSNKLFTRLCVASNSNEKFIERACIQQKGDRERFDRFEQRFRQLSSILLFLKHIGLSTELTNILKKRCYMSPSAIIFGVYQ